MSISRVLVTGSAGLVGRYAVSSLEAAGFRVRGADVVRTTRSADLVVDLQDFGQVLEAMHGMDAVIHLAAIPSRFIHTESVTFRNNIMSTFNVFEAAAMLGLERVTWASSETTMGVPWGRGEVPKYFPIDEDHPHISSPSHAYSLSKVLAERMSEHFSDRADIIFTMLRISNVIDPKNYGEFTSWQDDPRIRLWNGWAYIDARDVAEACVASLCYAPTTRVNAYNIVASDSVMTTPTAQLIADHFPQVEVRSPIEGTSSTWTNSKATRELGFTPRFGWRS